MSEYYNPKRSRNMYLSGSKEPFKLSRSKIDLFTECPRCFFLDRKLGVGRPPGFPFNLNSAVDHLLKKEFDIHRSEGTAHALMKTYGIDAVPFKHKDIDMWRENFVGVQIHHETTNFIITGAVDDIWLGSNGELHIVDYKATSKDEKVTLNAAWQNGYKRQMEVYQWLLRKKGFTVSDTGYFVYANGKKDKKAFDGKLEFDVDIISYTGKTAWIEKILQEIKECLDSEEIPETGASCDYCMYREAAGKSLKEVYVKNHANKGTKK